MRRIICMALLCCLLALPVCAAGEERYLALTFDDGPSGRFTSRLLDGLAEREVRATFFLCGYRVEQYPELTARIAREGHEIGTHGYAHKFFSALSAKDVCCDLERAQRCIEDAGGGQPTLLRPPGGIYDSKVLQQSVCADLPVVLWSVDPEDWRRSDSGAVAADIIREAKNGDVILLHDMSDSSVDAALRVIDELTAQGFRFVTVSELAALSGTQLQGGQVYHRFSFAKNDSISGREAETEPCTKPGFPPPLPRSASFIARQSGRRSPSRVPMAY